MTTVHAYAAKSEGAEFEPFEYEPGELGHDEVDVEVSSCGICHSDLSMLQNDWGMTEYPFVGGHEAIGKIVAVGDSVTHLEKGDTVGVGWFAHSDGVCHQCRSGHQNLCPKGVGTIVGRHGAFADRVRAQGQWVLKIPDGVDTKNAGPLFCGGITVFNPIAQFGIKPTDRVGVVGIGGLGHLAVQFLSKWGCEVTAFTSSDSKTREAHKLGAHKVVDSTSDKALDEVAGRYDFIISTVNVPLNWEKYFAALSPRGRFHVAGAVLEPIPVAAMPMILGQKQLSGSPVGAPATIADMLEFCGRHGISPVTEHFPMDKINDAFEHLRSGKPRYRIVLDR